MKKISVFILFLAANIAVSCNSGESTHSATSTDSTAVSTDSIIATTPSFTITPTPAHNVVPIAVANSGINDYITVAGAAAPPLWFNNSFIFKDATQGLNDLEAYISLPEVDKVHLILARVGNHEQLYISCVDTAGHHIYVKDGAGNKYVYTTSLNFATKTNGPATQVTEAILSPYIRANDALNAAPASTFGILNPIVPPSPAQPKFKDIIMNAGAATLVDNYCTNGHLHKTTFSFTYDAKQLVQYIQDARALSGHNIAALQFYLGRVPAGELKMIMVGLDATGNHIYLKGNGTNTVNHLLDQCLPCPPCHIVNNAAADVSSTTATSFKLEL